MATISNPQPKEQQKRINGELADLFLKGMTGNGKTAFERRYYATGAQAAKATNHRPYGETYWPGNKTAGRSFVVWYVLSK